VSSVKSVFYRMASRSICARLRFVKLNKSPQRTQRIELLIFALFAVRSINCLHRIFAIDQPSTFICVHVQLNRTALPAGGGLQAFRWCLASSPTCQSLDASRCAQAPPGRDRCRTGHAAAGCAGQGF
jgi:hypothetical protein